MLLVLAAACGSAPATPRWQTNAYDALQSFQHRYLAGESAAQVEFTRARSELAATGRADLVARAELIRCAARVASLVFEPCTGFEALRADASADERAYADYLEARAPRRVSDEPFARLVGYAVQLRAGSITPQAIGAAVELASAQGWRRALLAWLAVQLKRAEDAGDSETAARLRRRIELVSG